MKVYDVITSWKHNYESRIERVGMRREEKKRNCNKGWELRHNDSVELIPYSLLVLILFSPPTHTCDGVIVKQFNSFSVIHAFFSMPM